MPRKLGPIPDTFKKPVAASKKKAAAAAATIPFSGLQINPFKQVVFNRDNASWIEVTVYTSGYVGADEFKFDLDRDGKTLSFQLVIPSRLFNKAPPDHEQLTQDDRKKLKNDSRTVQYSTLTKTLRATLEYDRSPPRFAEVQSIALDKLCENIVQWTAYASPTPHVVSGHQQYSTAFVCKLKVAEKGELKRNRGNGIVVAGRSFDEDDSDDDNADDSSSSSDDESDARVGRRGGGGGGGGGKKTSGGGGSGKTKKKSKSTSSNKWVGTVGVKLEESRLGIKSESTIGIKCAKPEPGTKGDFVDLCLSQNSIA